MPRDERHREGSAERFVPLFASCHRFARSPTRADGLKLGRHSCDCQKGEIGSLMSNSSTGLQSFSPSASSMGRRDGLQHESYESDTRQA
jgi:hypothetical protein